MRPRATFPILALLFLTVTRVPTLAAQFTPAVNAIQLPDTLVFSGSGTVSNASLVWHPVHSRYYSVRIGNATFPLHTWLAAGGLSVFASTAGIDTRGLWYNPTTAQVERNCLGALGWATMEIDAGFNAVNTFTMILSGQLQPNAQSVAAYDPMLDQVLFYNAGDIQFRSRANGTVAQTLTITGIGPLANINALSVIWTGQLNYEIGVLDFVNKRVLLIDRSTGAVSATVQLPASSVTHNQFRFCYTNDRVWLFNATFKRWNAYCIWNEPCLSATLPVELTRFNGACSNGSAFLNWATASEHNSSHFLVERSADAVDWATIGRVEAAGYSQGTIDYHYMDPKSSTSPVVYYRLRQVDLDGREEVFATLSLENCTHQKGSLFIHPNPATDHCTVRVDGLVNDKEPLRLIIVDVLSRQLRTAVVMNDGRGIQDLDLQELPAGTYQIILMDAAGNVMESTALVKQ